MSIYRHGNKILNIDGSKSRVYNDDVLIFQGSTQKAVVMFVDLCDDKVVAVKFAKYLNL